MSGCKGERKRPIKAGSFHLRASVGAELVVYVGR